MDLTQGRPVTVERVRLTGKDTAIEGSFELPQLARLDGDRVLDLDGLRWRNPRPGAADGSA